MVNHEFPVPLPTRVYFALNQKMHFKEGVMTLGQFLDTKHIHRKSFQRDEYAGKRVNLEYKRLARPKVTYSLWWMEDDKEVGILVNKSVYEHIVIKGEGDG